MEEQQRLELSKLLTSASSTWYGKKYTFSSISTYEEFAERVPVIVYDDIVTEIEDIKHGKSDVLWKGVCSFFAVSSGTTGKGKHIPLSKERVLSDRRFLRSSLKLILRNPKHWSVVMGEILTIPGVIERQTFQDHTIIMGEVSGILAFHTPEILKRVTFGNEAEMLFSMWEDKLQALMTQALNSRSVRMIVGVPSWILVLFQRICQHKHISSIHEHWPNLSIISTGGVALASYKKAIESYLTTPVTWIEHYGASEGYIASGNVTKGYGLWPHYSNGLVYELQDVENNRVYPVWKAEVDKLYGLLITNNSGLWRYKMRDTVRFDAVGKLHVVGRTGECADFYGEALLKSEVLQTLANLGIQECIGVAVRPKPIQNNSIPKLELLVFLSLSPLKIVDARIFDHEIQKLNRHYAIRRETNALQALDLTLLSAKELPKVLKEHGLHQRGQQKLPFMLPPRIHEKQ